MYVYTYLISHIYVKHLAHSLAYDNYFYFCFIIIIHYHNFESDHSDLLNPSHSAGNKASVTGWRKSMYL